MRAYELMKETFLRKNYVRIEHISWLAIYGLLFLIPFTSEVWKWGPFLFIWSGCVLPILLSAGIFGDDIASGRICVLVTKPFWLRELYIYRLMGLSLQAVLHLVLAGCIIFILHSGTGRGSIDNLGLWILSSWLVFNTWAALSTSLSVVVRREYNSLLLFVGIGFVYFLVGMLMTFYRDHAAADVFIGFLRYACPPVELLFKLAIGKYSLIKSVACVIHSLALTAIYGIVGVVILSKREFKFQPD